MFLSPSPVDLVVSSGEYSFDSSSSRAGALSVTVRTFASYSLGDPAAAHDEGE
jgi:hypothetical protein